MSNPALQAFELTPETKEIAARYAAQLNVSPELAPTDHLLGFLINMLGKEKAIAEYFSGGHRDAQQVMRLVDRCEATRPVGSVLEFASGYGRVTRHLTAAIGKRKLIASDIHIEACDFIRSTFGCETRHSSSEPADLKLGDGFDLVFVLSLFSHLPPKSFGGWLSALSRKVGKNGFLMFTTHGEASMEGAAPPINGKLDRAPGYLYQTYSDQKDIPGTAYGTMVVASDWVHRAIVKEATGFRLESFKSQEWWNLQDEWVLRRLPE